MLSNKFIYKLDKDVNMKKRVILISLIIVSLIVISGCPQPETLKNFERIGVAPCRDTDSLTTYQLDTNQANKAGKVTFNSPQVGELVYPDSCKGKKLYEYYCHNSEWRVEVVSCNCIEVTERGETLARCES